MAKVFVPQKIVLTAFDEQASDHPATKLIQGWLGVSKTDADKGIQRARDGGFVEEGGPLGEQLSRKGREQLAALDNLVGPYHQRRMSLEEDDDAE